MIKCELQKIPLESPPVIDSESQLAIYIVNKECNINVMHLLHIHM